MVDGVSHGELVGIPAEGDAETGAPVAEVRVIIGDPDESYLMKKLLASEGIVGERMPEAVALDDDRLALVRDWIAAGALDD